MKVLFPFVVVVTVLVAAMVTAFYDDGADEEKAKCNICTKVIAPALDTAIFASTPKENTKQVVEDTIHALPKKFRYALETHEVKEHDKPDAECELIKQEVHQFMWDPMTVASLSALVRMFHENSNTKHHLLRLIEHTICPCEGNDHEVGPDDGQFHEMLQAHQIATHQEQDLHDLHHNWHDVPRPHDHEHEPLPDPSAEDLERIHDEMHHDEAEPPSDAHDEGGHDGGEDEQRDAHFEPSQQGGENPNAGEL